MDNDCDGDIDEDDSVDESTWYADSDTDGEGDASVSDIDCYQPTGYVANSTDCNDGDAAMNHSDYDGDGFTSCGGDCDDSSSSIYPSAPEFCSDGIDQDCDGEDLLDGDGDGYDDEDWGGTDCDDADASINPGASETIGDGVDYDCDSTEICYADADEDGWGDVSPALDTITVGTDCNDDDATEFAGAVTESTSTECMRDADGDGYGDNPLGTTGDMFPNDPTRTQESEADGYHDAEYE